MWFLKRVSSHDSRRSAAKTFRVACLLRFRRLCTVQNGMVWRLCDGIRILERKQRSGWVAEYDPKKRLILGRGVRALQDMQVRRGKVATATRSFQYARRRHHILNGDIVDGKRDSRRERHRLRMGGR